MPASGETSDQVSLCTAPLFHLNLQSALEEVDDDERASAKRLTPAKPLVAALMLSADTPA
jgi:hypothetical protein